MNIDMELGERWPEVVNLEVQVHYAMGLPDCKMIAIAPCVSSHAVRVLVPRAGFEPLEVHRVGWVDLPGHSLYLRCLSVLALHWFGSLDMVPRVRGAPLWRSLSVEMTMPALEGPRLKFDLQVTGDSIAALRYQFRREDALVSHVVELDALDADPLRALLRVGSSRIKPVAALRKPASPPARSPSLRIDSGVHAPEQRV